MYNLNKNNKELIGSFHGEEKLDLTANSFVSLLFTEDYIPLPSTTSKYLTLN